ncbi:MAG TPA: SapC family protein, partial [Burkholderiaceae bacterium]|nr:SapC family protein [Burkholderiaceae bacterium]
ALQKHDLVAPWPLECKTDAGVHVVDGLYRIDRTKLNKLSAHAFQDVRQAGALPLVYCHLLSMQHMHTLVHLASTAREQAAGQGPLAPGPAGDLDLEFLNNDGTLCFGEARSLMQGYEVHP